MTNKCPTGPNRGYACGHLYFEMERMVDLRAQRLRMDPAQVRRRNFIRADQFPYRTPSGGVYDSGDYAAAFDRALEVPTTADCARRRAAPAPRGGFTSLDWRWRSIRPSPTWAT